jgi:hypothetical protein
VGGWVGGKKVSLRTTSHLRWDVVKKEEPNKFCYGHNGRDSASVLLGTWVLGLLGTYNIGNWGTCVPWVRRLSRIWALGHLGSWESGNQGHMVLGLLGTWASGLSVIWALGHLGSQSSGLSVIWALGHLGSWVTGL